MAQTPDAPPDPVVQASQIGDSGVALFKKGRWAEAFERFAAAEQLVHSPVFVVYMARAQRAAGRLLAARPLYRRVASEVVTPEAHKSWHDAKSEAVQELAELDREIPRLRAGASAGGVLLRVDGVPVAPPGTLVEVDPGVHRIEAMKGAARVGRIDVTVSRGSGIVDAVVPIDDPEKRKGPIAPGAVTLATGLASLLVGAVAGGVALAREAEVKSRCDLAAMTCLESDKSLADSAITLSHVSTAGLVIGGTLSTVGIVLMVVRPGGQKPRALGRLCPAIGGATIGAELTF
jgi:hypothetical protein